MSECQNNNNDELVRLREVMQSVVSGVKVIEERVGNLTDYIKENKETQEKRLDKIERKVDWHDKIIYIGWGVLLAIQALLTLYNSVGK